MICAQFGQISHCEVAVDRTGRSFGEAEVEFVQKQSALDCITKLDNEVADGKATFGNCMWIFCSKYYV